MTKAKQKETTIQKTAGRKIIDVAHPNDTAPPENSKSVIIKHQPMMRDPMMTAPAPEAKVEDVLVTPAEPAVVRHERVIMPGAATPVGPVTPVATVVNMPAEPAVTETLVDKSFTVSESIPEDDLPGYTTQKSPQLAEADAETEADERRQTLNDLVQKQTYFLPIGSTGQQKKKRYVTLGIFLAIILAAAWFNIALDAELIQISGIEAPTDFFKN